MCLEYDPAKRASAAHDRQQAEHIDALRGALKDISNAETLGHARSIALTALDFKALTSVTREQERNDE